MFRSPGPPPATGCRLLALPGTALAQAFPGRQIDNRGKVVRDIGITPARPRNGRAWPGLDRLDLKRCALL